MFSVGLRLGSGFVGVAGSSANEAFWLCLMCLKPCTLHVGSREDSYFGKLQMAWADVFSMFSFKFLLKHQPAPLMSSEPGKACLLGWH